MKNFYEIFKICFLRSKLGLCLLIILSLISSSIELIGFSIIIPVINLSMSESVRDDKFSEFINDSLQFLVMNLNYQFYLFFAHYF